MPGLNLKAAQWEQQHKTHVEEYLRQIEALYDVASDELIRLGMGHDSENTTQIYLASLDTTVVDKANKRILDLL